MSSFPIYEWVIACWASVSMTHAILYPDPQLVGYDLTLLTLSM